MACSKLDRPYLEQRFSRATTFLGNPPDMQQVEATTADAAAASPSKRTDQWVYESEFPPLNSQTAPAATATAAGTSGMEAATPGVQKQPSAPEQWGDRADAELGPPSSQIGDYNMLDEFMKEAEDDDFEYVDYDTETSADDTEHGDAVKPKPGEEEELPPSLLDILKTAAMRGGLPWPRDEAPPATNTMYDVFGSCTTAFKRKRLLPEVNKFYDTLATSWKSPAEFTFDKAVNNWLHLLQHFFMYSSSKYFVMFSMTTHCNTVVITVFTLKETF